MKEDTTIRLQFLVSTVAYSCKLTYNFYIQGFLSVLCRQTNIIWVALVAGKYVLTELYKITVHRTVTRETEHTIPSKVGIVFHTIL